MKNSLLAEEISFYGAAESAYFYGEDAAGAGANAGANAGAANAASAQNPYAVLALFDASFATFGADYAEALAAINAAIADLSGAIAKLDAAKGDTTKLEDVKKAVTAGALERAKSTADFAANVAARESKIAATTEKIATAMGVSAGKDASAEQLAAALTAKVASELKITTKEIAQTAANVEHSGAMAAKLAKVASAQLKDVAGAISEAKTAEAEALQQSDYAEQKAKAQLAKKAATLEAKYEAAKAAGKDGDALKALENLAKEAADAASDPAAIDTAKSEVDAQKEKITAAAQKAEQAKAALEKASDAELESAVAEAKDAVEKIETAKAEAAKQEAANADKFMLEEVASFDKIYFKDLEAYGKFAKDKGALADVKAAVAALELNKLADAGIVVLDGWTAEYSSAEKTLTLTDAAGGPKFVLSAPDSDAKTLADAGKALAHWEDGKFTAGDIAKGAIASVNGLKIAANSVAKDNIDVTVAEGVTMQIKPHGYINGEANSGKIFAADDLKELAALTAATKASEIKSLSVAKIGGAALAHVSAQYEKITAQGVDFLIDLQSEKATLQNIAKVAAATKEADAKTAATNAGALEVVALTIATGTQTGAIKDIANWANLVAGKAAAINKTGLDSGAVKGYMLKDAAGALSWIAAGAQITISGVKDTTQQDDLVAVSGDEITIAKAKKLIAGTTLTFEKDGKSIAVELSGTAAHTATIAGAKLTFADATQLGQLAEIDGESKVSALQTANVSKIGDIELQASCGLKIGTVTLTHHADATLADVKGLSAASTGWQLNKAKITAVAGTQIEYDDSDLVKMTITGAEPEKKYDISNATLENIAKLANNELTTDEALKNANIIEITNIVADLTTDGYKTLTTIDQLLEKAGASSLKKGQDVLVKDASGAIGYINKAGDDGYEYAPDAGDLGISKLKTTATIADLKKVKDNDATYTDLLKIAADDASVEHGRTHVSIAKMKDAVAHKMADASLDSSAKAIDVADFAASESVGDFKKIIGASANITNGTFTKASDELQLATTNEKIILKGTAKLADAAALKQGSAIADIAAVASKVGNTTVVSATELKTNIASTAVSITGFDAAKATVATIAGLAANATATQLKTLVDFSSGDKTLTVGTTTLKFAQTSGKATITDAAITLEVKDGATADKIAAYKANANDIVESSTVVFSFADKSTLDLSSYTGISAAKAAEGAELAAGSSVSLSMAKSAKLTVSTPELKGDGAKIITINLSDFDSSDVLKLNFASVKAGEGKDSIGTSFTVGGQNNKTVKTVADSGNLGAIKLSDNSVATVNGDTEAVKIAQAIDKDAAGAGQAGCSYILKSSETVSETKSVVYIINAGTANDGDAVIVKLVGIDDADSTAISGNTITYTQGHTN